MSGTHWPHRSRSRWPPPLPRAEELAGGREQPEPPGLERRQRLQHKSAVLHWLLIPSHFDSPCWAAEAGPAGGPELRKGTTVAVTAGLPWPASS